MCSHEPFSHWNNIQTLLSITNATLHVRPYFKLCKSQERTCFQSFAVCINIFGQTKWHNQPACCFYKDKNPQFSFLLLDICFFSSCCKINASNSRMLLFQPLMTLSMGYHTTSLTLMHFLQAQWNCFSCSALTMIYPLWSLLLAGIEFLLIYR